MTEDELIDELLNNQLLLMVALVEEMPIHSAAIMPMLSTPDTNVIVKRLDGTVYEIPNSSINYLRSVYNGKERLH